MALVELRDRDAIAEFCRRRPAVHAYELGDLDDFFWPHTRWYAWQEHDRIEQLALVYAEHELPVLLAFAEDPLRTMELLVQELLPLLPPRIYAHLTPSLVDAVTDRYAPKSAGRHLKLGLARNDLLFEAEDAVVLSPDDLADVQAFYAEAYPGTWFVPRMLESERYVGLREGDRLVCIAGVHVWSTKWHVAALGNVATLPSARGRGLATAACSQLCRLLLDDGIDTIGLNVRADNVPALTSYMRLGFEPVAQYDELLLEVPPGGVNP
jgi:ribosomal protein S18 acetylase RimI-like enzyme